MSDLATNRSIDVARMQFGDSSEDIPTSLIRNNRIGERSLGESTSSRKINTWKKRPRSWWRKCTVWLTIVALFQVCVLIAVIGLMYSYSFYELSNANNDHQSGAKPLVSYRVYTNGQNTSRLLVGLVDGCNQREHDFHLGVACHSKQMHLCKKLGLHHSQTQRNNLKIKESQQTSEDLKPRRLVIITSSRSGKLLESRQLAIEGVNSCLASEEPHCGFRTRVRVYLQDRQQTIIGWGGALTDSAINNILALSVNGTRSLLDDYFSRSIGLGYNMARITIGGSDFSGRFYTNDDIARPQSDDFTMERFKLTEEDSLYKVPILRLIQTEYEQPVKLFASMWSPPLWMKTNNHFNKGQIRGTLTNMSSYPQGARYFHALAELKARFVAAYQRESIKFWALTVMNEPFFARQPFLDFNTMIFPPNDYAIYLASILGPRFRRDPALRHIKLIVHDDNRKFLLNETEPILSRGEVQKFVDGVATHGYVDEHYHLMSELYERHQRRLFILPDELCSGHLPFMQKALIGNWERAIHYGLDIIRSLQHRAAGWVDWNMALDTEGGPGWLGGRLDSPIIVDKARDIYYKSPMYYAIGQFSRYIPEGSIKLADRVINDKYDFHFETVTFLTPDKRQLVTVILNDNPYPIELIIEPLKSAQHIAPSQNAGFLVRVDAESITTVLYPLPEEYINSAMDVALY